MNTNLESKAQLQNGLINTIKELYAKGDKIGVIDKSMLAVEMGLAIGYNSYMMTTTLIDLGVRPEELGTAISLAVMRTDDKYLNDIDKKIKIESNKIWSNIK